jgi:3-methyl-2-oxobutanoate hydroxymethyltransferase|nr:3-methyl-2-oxobutanoate hydroxymethyltransferase [Candidatus Krumholzibacteria bacterium]
MAGKGRPSTLDVFARGKSEGRKITVLTAYDLTSALLAARGGVDAILVGDSLGMVVLGFENTLPVTLEHTLHHCAAVSRARPGLPIIADMPFGSFHVSVEDTVRQALRLVKEGGATAVKIEGGRRRLDMIAGLLRAEIPVMGHLGLTPQSVHRFGGYKVQGRGEDAAAALRDEARLLQEAGCFALVLECVPAELAAQISADLEIPTIGIGAGPGCDGQVLVFHDMLGLFDGLKPKFVKRFAELGDAAAEAIGRYVTEVREGSFPGPEHTYGEKPRRKTGEGGLPQSAAPELEKSKPKTTGYLADMANGKDKS